jgi:hypothetical protein
VITLPVRQPRLQIQSSAQTRSYLSLLEPGKLSSKSDQKTAFIVRKLFRTSGQNTVRQARKTGRAGVCADPSNQTTSGFRRRAVLKHDGLFSSGVPCRQSLDANLGRSDRVMIIKNALYYGFYGRGKVKERLKRAEKMYVDLQLFPFHKNSPFSTLMAISQDNAVENSGKECPVRHSFSAQQCSL